MNLINRTKGSDGRAMTPAAPRGDALTSLREEIDEVFDRMLKPFGSLGRLSVPREFRELAGVPALDVAENDKEITLRLDAPGMKSADFDVEAEDGVLTVRGRRSDEWEEKKDDLWRRERWNGQFSRAVALPASADTKKVEANYFDGVLTVHVGKRPEAKPNKVKVSG